MGQIGEELERARKQKGLSLHEVENTTKIRVKYLAALETENFSVLPGRVYVIGFLRTYGRFLGLDDELLVSQFKEQVSLEKPAEDEKQVNSRPEKKINKGLLKFLLIAALALITVAVYYFGTKDGNINTAPDNQPQVQNPAVEEGSNNSEIPQEQENEGTEEETESGVIVIVNIKESNCWLDVTIDGKSNFRGTVYAGESRTFSGDESVRIKFGNAGAAEVIYNGNSIYPVGAMRQVVTKEYAANNQ